MASLKDLNKVKGSMKEILNLRGMCNINPAYLSGRDCHVKLMELLCHTDYDFNRCDYLNQNHPLMVACREGCTEIVNLLVRSSKECGIDLNTRDFLGRTGFIWACQY